MEPNNPIQETPNQSTQQPNPEQSVKQKGFFLSLIGILLLLIIAGGAFFYYINSPLNISSPEQSVQETPSSPINAKPVTIYFEDLIDSVNFVPLFVEPINNYSVNLGVNSLEELRNPKKVVGQFPDSNIIDKISGYTDRQKNLLLTIETNSEAIVYNVDRSNGYAKELYRLNRDRETIYSINQELYGGKYLSLIIVPYAVGLSPGMSTVDLIVNVNTKKELRLNNVEIKGIDIAQNVIQYQKRQEVQKNCTKEDVAAESIYCSKETDTYQVQESYGLVLSQPLP